MTVDSARPQNAIGESLPVVDGVGKVLGLDAEGAVLPVDGPCLSPDRVGVREIVA